MKTKADFKIPAEWVDWTWDCRDKGVCCHCEKPVVSGQALYGLDGSHYECHEAVCGPYVDSFAEVKKAFDASHASHARLMEALEAVKEVVNKHDADRPEPQPRLVPIRHAKGGNIL